MAGLNVLALYIGGDSEWALNQSDLLSWLAEASVQLGIFGFELGQSIAKRADGLADFLLGKARRDVLRLCSVQNRVTVNWGRVNDHLIFWFSPITPAGVPVMAAVTAATI
jgi:hypothetical protein